MTSSPLLEVVSFLGAPAEAVLALFFCWAINASKEDFSGIFLDGAELGSLVGEEGWPASLPVFFVWLLALGLATGAG